MIPTSIEALLKEEIIKRSDRYYQVHGMLRFLDITSPYQQTSDGRTLSYGAAIGRFRLSGVIEQEGHVLAFQYKANDILQSRREKKSIRGFERDKEEMLDYKMLDYIDEQRNANVARYLHLLAALHQDKPTVHVQGWVSKARPRTFFAGGIFVEGKVLAYGHGEISGDFADKPELR